MKKIIFVTDVHDSLIDLKNLLEQTEANLYLICGDILYYAFYDMDKVIQFVTLQEEFYELGKEQNRDIFSYDLATEILRDSSKNIPNELYLKAAEYRLLFHQAAKTMKEKYKKIEDLINKYSNATCFVLPGNYDIDFKYTALASRNLHKRIMYYENLSFGGYGGAPIRTSGIPEKLAVPYLEGGKGKEFYSEPQEFFEENHPDILVLHNPAYGYFDRVNRYGHVGSLGIRNYLDENQPILVLSGHVHEDYGVFINKKGTVFMNPSNFGSVESIHGFTEGGIFAEIYLEEKRKQVDSIIVKRIYHNSIYEYFQIIFYYDNIPTMEYKKLKDFDFFYLDFEQFFRKNPNVLY